MSKIKNSILKLWSLLTSIYLQVILGFIAFLSWNRADYLGKETSEVIAKGGTVFIGNNRSSEQMPEEIAAAVTSGYDGGALAMGLITCACLISIVWLEVNKSKLRK
mgnify:FL=1